MLKGLVISLLVAVTAISSTSHTSQALPAANDLTQALLARAQQAEEHVQAAMDRKAQRQAELDARRQAIEQRLADRRAAVVEKLSGERAERCEEKEATINQVLDNRVVAAERHLDKLKTLHDKLAVFAIEKKLDVDNASALELILSEKQDDAQASIDAVKALDFECANTDANAPGMIVKDQFTEAKQALKDYRTAIKDYALAVRNAATATVEGTSTETSQSSETQTETTTDEQSREVTQ